LIADGEEAKASMVVVEELWAVGAWQGRAGMEGEP
jgi:hypothetical protein